jgi:hypothetical protein
MSLFPLDLVVVVKIYVHMGVIMWCYVLRWLSLGAGIVKRDTMHYM